MTNYDKVYTAIVLQGGGALGAYEYGVLKALYEKRPGFGSPDVSVGHFRPGSSRLSPPRVSMAMAMRASGEW